MDKKFTLTILFDTYILELCHCVLPVAVVENRRAVVIMETVCSVSVITVSVIR
jgi:hypothetical protein